ncbi:hypothetical protein MUG78_02530 [Gordonia alkaliphila]|uniref:hypothetical protein n=1 Tax=Gordonia alkaliphila TaxID=1053547 RepID=UPI001FF51E45|nr:hypothetical protein [Gordonia alkaliphila]MCK0438366.1 hypothetical protein [Gordonia alkaliphila]
MSDDAVPTPTASTGRGLPRILEIRTHGVSGTPPEQILARPTAAANTGAIHAVPDSTAPDRGFTHLVDLQGNPVTEPGNPDHHVWAYSWGSMTSGGWKKALWALLIPFALINMAYAMLPDSSGAIAARFTRASMHLLGLALTVLFTMQVSMLVLDLVAYQCLGSATDGLGCLGKVPGHGLLASEPDRLAVAGTVLLIALMALITTITRFTEVDEVGPADTELAAAAGGGPEAETTLESQDFHDGSPLASGLRAVHGIAAPTTLVLVMTLANPDGEAGYWWLIPLGVLIALAVMLAGTDLRDLAAFTRSARLPPQCQAFIRAVARTTGLIAYLVAAGMGFWYLPDRLADNPGSGSLYSTSRPIEITLVICLCLSGSLLLASLVVVCRSKFASWAGFPDRYRPWLHGLGAWVVSGLGIAFGAGFGAGAAHGFELLAARKWTTAPSDVALEMPWSYSAISLMWGLIALLLLVVGALVLVVTLFCFAFRSFIGWVIVPLPNQSEYPDTWQRSLSGMDSTTPAPGSVRRAWGLAANHDRLPAVLFVLLMAIFSALIAAIWLLRADYIANSVMTWIQLLGTVLLILFVGGIGWAIQRSIRSPDVGRKFGVLWDVASFWPREGHPVVPQSYATVVIHDIVTRVEHEQKADPTRKIVLCGHSQGSLIMYAAALRLLRRQVSTPQNLSLLTYGSQLRWIYGRAFPAHLNFHSNCHLFKDLDGRWINLIRPTDPVGGSVLSWNVRLPGADQNPQGSVAGFQGNALAVTGLNRFSWATRTSGITDEDQSRIRYLEIGNERWLPDPPPVVEYAFSRGHSNYVRDPAWPRFVQELVGQPDAPGPVPAAETDGAD